MVSVKDIYWAAGIYEGEGNFSGKGISVTQKDTWILWKLRTLFGFGSITPKSSNSCSQWVVTGQNARGFLLTIFSLLSPRRKEQILAHKIFFKDTNYKGYDSCKNGHAYIDGSYDKIYSRTRKKVYKRCKVCHRNKLNKEKLKG